MQQNDNVWKLACLLQVINMYVHFVELLTFMCYRIRFSGCLYNLVVLHIWQAIIARRDLYFNLQIKVFIYLQSGLYKLDQELTNWWMHQRNRNQTRKSKMNVTYNLVPLVPILVFDNNNANDSLAVIKVCHDNKALGTTCIVGRGIADLLVVAGEHENRVQGQNSFLGGVVTKSMVLWSVEERRIISVICVLLRFVHAFKNDNNVLKKKVGISILFLP